ncbi:MAG: hypothetical protein A2X04_11630 [Bacteroidetes bacterium GWF2_41_9]|nr:MAG: hypothetical protein A2X06_16450 [Bacteroidetes bacterium GWC2_40_22]OFY61695.1 MAG: hypothetical protein A2X04_11630 [Bacteroidetes bacterium GWF2_41_9]HAM09592.1 hypothetical protein [Bacteroidales bacterium]HBH84246.1 hypothetical protein [Bacteroidales bacterium]
MKKLLILAVTFNLWALSLYGQGDLNEQQKVFFRNEKSFGIQLNTDGIGFNFRTAKRTDYLNKNIIEYEIGTLKHPKEYKLSNPYTQGTSFIFGKLNFPLYIRASIGRQHELYKKADLGGVAIRYFYSGGPALAVYKPIYYKVIYPVSLTEYLIREEKFNTSIAVRQEIWGRAAFTKGISETKVMPGIYAKTGFNFEYSKEDKVIHAIEIGATLSAYLKEIPIMASPDNKSIFFSLFVSYRFGIVVNPLDPESNKVFNIFRRKK